MDIFCLSPDSTIDEYELNNSPGERHIPLEWATTPYWDSYVHSLNTDSISGSRKDLTDKQLVSENKIMVDFVMSYYNFIFTAFVSDLDRLYDSYCLVHYRQKKPVVVEYSYFVKVIVDYFNLNFRDQDAEEIQNVEQVEAENENSIEQTEENPQNIYFHVFDEVQMELKMKLHRDSVLARRIELYYEAHKEFPDINQLEKSLQVKMDRDTSILKSFFEAGRKEPSLSERCYYNDFFFSFEHDDHFVFFYGKSVYRFRYDDSHLYLNGKVVNLENFFRQLVPENKRVWKHTIRIGKLFERKGIEYNQGDKETTFFIYRCVEELDTFIIRYNNAETRILWDKRNLYRLTGEQIVEPSILVHEMIELDGQRKKASMKAKQFFKTFLTKVEKQELLQKKSILINGKNYVYIFCPEIHANPIIRIDKKDKSTKALCVMLEDPYIPRYDVLASALLLVKSGHENRLNKIVNEFELNDDHKKVLCKY